MATAYPDGFACPQIANFSMTLLSGVIRDASPNQAQRRVFTHMPTMIGMSFVMTVKEWSIWQAWVTANAFGWFTMKLPIALAGYYGFRMTDTVIRFTGDTEVSKIGKDHVAVNVTAEVSPSMSKIGFASV